MTPTLEMTNLGRSFSGFELKAIGLRVEPGSILGLIGPNGAGKTTLMKLIMGQMQPSSGDLRVCGLAYPDGLKEIRNRIGYVSEEPPFAQKKRVEEIAGFVGSYFRHWDSVRFGQLVDQFDINPLQRVEALSRGQKTLLSLAVALSHGADLLLLDEPAAGLDAIRRRQVLRLIAEFSADGKGSTVITTHQTDGLAPIADRIAFLHRGRLILEEGTEELLASWKWLHYRDGAGSRVLEEALVGRESGTFGNRGLIRTYPDHSEDLKPGVAAGDLHIRNATIDDILVSLTEGQ